jgi:cytochrome c oxidase subunit IV
VSRETLSRIVSYVALLALLGVSIYAAQWPLGLPRIGLHLGLGGTMALIVVAVFMQLRRTPALARLFAYAGVLWLGILFGLMSLDYVYR